MSLQFNQVLLSGHVTRDPQVRMVRDSTVADFGLAINRRYKNAAGEQCEEVTFVDCSAWGKTAEVIGKHVTKGYALMVEGRLKLDQWDDAKTGEKRSKLRVVVDRCHFVESKGGGAPGPVAAAPAAAGVPTSDPRTLALGNDEPPF